MRPRPDTTRRRCARGLTLLELMLALTVTAMVGTGIASMLSMVSDCATSDQDRRSVLLRSHAAQVRLRAYFSPALNVLAYDPSQGLAVWLQDDKPAANVHLTELRILWFDSVAGTISIERVQFPDAWSQVMKDRADLVLGAGSDFFDEMLAMRAMGHTATETIVDEVAAFEAEFVTPAATDSARVRLIIRLNDAGGGSQEMLLAFGLQNHQKPAS